jgi:hypothetical protein
MKYAELEVRLFPGKILVRWKPDGKWFERTLDRVGTERFFLPDFEGFIRQLRILNRELRAQPQAKTFLGAVFKPILDVSILEFPDRFYVLERQILEFSLRRGLQARRIHIATPEAFDKSLGPNNELRDHWGVQ